MPPQREGFLRLFGLKTGIGRFHARGQPLCKFIIRKEFNSHRIVLVRQHGHGFIVLEHQYGRRDVMWKSFVDFAYFGLQSGMVFEGTTGVCERIYRFNSKRERKKVMRIPNGFE